MPFVVGRGFAEVQILEKGEIDHISWTVWNSMMTFCKHIDIDKI